MSRPTELNFRSPKEVTPGFHDVKVSILNKYYPLFNFPLHIIDKFI